jgi:deoxycytidylate deaminase
MTSENIWGVIDALGSFTNCEKRRVGCVIYNVKTGRIVGKGWNVHLNGICDCHTKKTAQHAEISAILDMTEEYDAKDLVAYVSHKPCANCASVLKDAVLEVRYRHQ